MEIITSRLDQVEGKLSETEDKAEELLNHDHSIQELWGMIKTPS
jgi:hypothetical protein